MLSNAEGPRVRSIEMGGVGGQWGESMRGGRIMGMRWLRYGGCGGMKVPTESVWEVALSLRETRRQIITAE